MDRQTKGRLGENLALKHLQNKGYKLQAQNFQTKFGEIDLIFFDKETLVFVEVKTRKYFAQGLPEEAVTPRKLSTITRVGEYYTVTNNLNHKLARIDVVAVELTTDPPTIRHLINVSQ